MYTTLKHRSARLVTSLDLAWCHSSLNSSVSSSLYRMTPICFPVIGNECHMLSQAMQLAIQTQNETIIQLIQTFTTTHVQLMEMETEITT